MAESEKDEQETKVNGTEVKIKTPRSSKVRPVYSCHDCNMSFPSQLDLEEHHKIDHSKKVTAA